MKLAAITDEISMDFAYALDVLKEYGAESAELRGLWGKNVTDLTDAEVEEARKILADKGFSVCSIATPVLKCELQVGTSGETGRMHDAKERSRDQQIELLKHCIELADKFDTKIIRVFSFWKRGEMTPEIEDQVVEELTAMAEIAEKHGKILGLENEHDCYVSTGVEMGRVISRVNSPALKAVWDPGNAFYAGEDPFPGGYEACKDQIAHVHIKDAERLQTGKQRFVVVGEGMIDYKGQFAALAASDYTGYISLETHYIPFAGTNETGSRLCLAALRHFIDSTLGNAAEVKS